MKTNLILLLAALIAISTTLIHPSPLFEQYNGQMLEVGTICNLFHFQAQHQLIDSLYYFNKITKRLNRNLQCSKNLMFLQDAHTPLAVAQSVSIKPQAYQIRIDQDGIEIVFGDYSGYIYALETLSQLYSNKKLPHATIKDEPILTHRGIMIDSARHFLKVSTIKRLIENMPQSKLNILHWHIVDDQSFPIQLNSHPQLSQYGSFGNSKIYTLDDIKNLISIADKNGVKIVPQIDTPAHMRSWVLSPALKAKNLTISCNIQNVTGKYSQIINPSKLESLRLVQDVITELDNIFKNSPYIHLGGNLINFDCWNRSDIATFKKLHHINSTEGLMEYWRFELKQILPTSRKIIYWINHAQNYPTSQKDVLQFNGLTLNLTQILKNTTSKIILSAFDVLDLSAGLSNVWMNSSNGEYNGWKRLYEGYNSLIQPIDKSRLLGAELLLWGSIANDDNLDQLIWMRAAVFGQRVWSAKTVPLSQLVASVTKIQKNLQTLGVNVMPLTGEFCQKYPTVCWPLSQQSSQQKKQYLVQ